MKTTHEVKIDTRQAISELFGMIKKSNRTDYEKGHNDAILDVVNKLKGLEVEG